MAEGLDLDALVCDAGKLRQGELARDRDAGNAQFADPGDRTRIMDVCLRRDMDLDLRPDAPDLCHEAPVLDDEGIGAKAPGTPDHGEHLRHLSCADHDVHGHIDADAGKMRCLAGSGKALVVEVRRIAAGIEVISEAAVDGIGTRSQGCRKRLGAACGSQKLEGALVVPVLHVPTQASPSASCQTAGRRAERRVQDRRCSSWERRACRRS